MGEFVDDIRAALVMNPNFCRLRFKKEDAPKKNGYIKREEFVTPKNTVICSNVSIQDANGNVCLQMKELNSQRKVTFKEHQTRLPLRRRASDIELGDANKVSSRKINCTKCSPTLLRNNDLSMKDKSSRGFVDNNYNGDTVEEITTLIGPCSEENSIEDMDYERDSKCSSSDTQSKESSCDIQVQVSESFPETSKVFDKEGAVDFETSESSLPRHANDVMTLDDILARYSTVLDESSLQVLQNSTEPPDLCNARERKPFAFLLIAAFILVPTLLFYFLAFLYFFQPEPFYSFLLRNLKLKDDARSSSLSSFIEFLNWVTSELYDYIYKTFEELVTNFN